MSGVVSEGGGGRGAASQDFDLNLAPIIDAFTVLIAFMLVSASFLSIGILDAGVAAAGASTTDTAPPSVNVTVELTKTAQMIVKVNGKANSTTTIEALEGERDYAKLVKNVAALKGTWSDLNAVTLMAEESVPYRDVIRAMENLKGAIPVVALGGF